MVDIVGLYLDPPEGALVLCAGEKTQVQALEIATGQVVTACSPRHRHQEFFAFRRRIVRDFPEGDLHLVLDNSSTHTTPEVERRRGRHKHINFHFTPTGASWMNIVESWFLILHPPTRPLRLLRQRRRPDRSNRALRRRLQPTDF